MAHISVLNSFASLLNGASSWESAAESPQALLHEISTAHPKFFQAITDANGKVNPFVIFVIDDCACVGETELELATMLPHSTVTIMSAVAGG